MFKRIDADHVHVRSMRIWGNDQGILWMGDPPDITTVLNNPTSFQERPWVDSNGGVPFQRSTLGYWIAPRIGGGEDRGAWDRGGGGVVVVKRIDPVKG